MTPFKQQSKEIYPALQYPADIHSYKITQQWHPNANTLLNKNLLSVDQ